MVPVSSVEHCKRRSSNFNITFTKTYFLPHYETGHFVSPFSFVRRESVFFRLSCCLCGPPPPCQIWKQISYFDGRLNEICTPEGIIKLSKIRHNMAGPRADGGGEIPSSRTSTLRQGNYKSNALL